MSNGGRHFGSGLLFQNPLGISWSGGVRLTTIRRHLRIGECARDEHHPLDLAIEAVPAGCVRTDEQSLLRHGKLRERAVITAGDQFAILIELRDPLAGAIHGCHPHLFAGRQHVGRGQ